tara:strand:+ start:87 stop:341 length:255 start_codon:yes stop_codon:yes gene_type:complete
MKDNKLIAEFMHHGFHNGKHRSFDELQYHESWDWLMPVHKKCMFTPNFSGDDQLRTLLIDAVIDADIDRLYDAVVEFIKEYNNG